MQFVHHSVSVLGLGYVGCVSAACLASQGHDVIGVDVDPAKVEMVAGGRAPVVEERIGDLTADMVRDGRLRATVDVTEAVRATDISLVCVGTPSARGGGPSTVYLERVAEEIGLALRTKGTRHTVVFRSTMWPGTCVDLLVPILEKHSGMTAGKDFGVAVNPEFLREGSSVRDYFEPPRTVIGEFDPAAGAVVAEIYMGLPGAVYRVPTEVAEMIKYVDNSFHALKIGFANEIGAVCAAHGLDSHKVIDLFLADEKLNLGRAYLRPGFAFGGSCLPKDLRGIVHAARRTDVAVPILEHVLPSNEEHLRRALDLVLATGQRQVGVFGLSFKSGTDDLRESPLVDLCERLLGKGRSLRIYDAGVSLSRLTGANRQFVAERLPHIGDLLTTSVADVVDHGGVCVVGSLDPDVLAALPSFRGHTVVDLVRLPDEVRRSLQATYVGLSW